MAALDTGQQGESHERRRERGEAEVSLIAKTAGETDVFHRPGGETGTQS